MKPLPRNDQLEKAYLAGVLLGGEEYLFPALQPSDFYSKAHAEIYGVMVTVASGGQTPSLEWMQIKCPQHAKTLLSILDVDAIPSLNTQYGKQLKETSTRRKLILELTEAAHKAAEVDDLSLFVEHTEERINRISTGTHKKSGVSLDNVYDADRMLTEYQEHINTLRTGVFKTGIKPIDDSIRGLAKGEVMTIIARSGCFKTAFLQSLLLRYANQANGNLSVFFSLEMPVASVAERFGQSLLETSGFELETRWRNRVMADWEVEQHRAGLRNVIVIPTRPNMRQMERFIPLIERKYKRRVGLIGIDYLGLVDAPGTKEYEKSSYVAVETKIMAKKLKVPVVLLSQLNRSGSDGNQRVTMDMARGSGQIEEAADIILGLWKNQNDMGFDLICSILKNRKGAVGSDIKIDLDPAHLSFYGGDLWEQPKRARQSHEDNGL